MDCVTGVKKMTIISIILHNIRVSLRDKGKGPIQQLREHTGKNGLSWSSEK